SQADQRQRGHDGEQVECPAAKVLALLAGPSSSVAVCQPGPPCRSAGGHVHPSATHRVCGSGSHDPTSTGEAAATAGRSVVATTATAVVGGRATMPTASARPAPGGTVTDPPGAVSVVPVQGSTTR